MLLDGNSVHALNCTAKRRFCVRSEMKEMMEARYARARAMSAVNMEEVRRAKLSKSSDKSKPRRATPIHTLPLLTGHLPMLASIYYTAKGVSTLHKMKVFLELSCSNMTESFCLFLSCHVPT